MNRTMKKAWSVFLATTMTVTALAGAIFTAPAAHASTTIDASSLKTWTVYDTYNYDGTNTKPSDWDTTINQYGRRPWYFYKDITHNTNSAYNN